jgi:xanthine dehydrogenase YagS FAD-binding subunit
MATTGGNLLQRTRCYYFTDTSFPACNKRRRSPDALQLRGYNRIHAILGQTDKGSTSAESCIATNPSDTNLAMAALGAVVEVEGAHGKRTIPLAEFHKLHDSTPWIETTVRPGELIVGVMLPPTSLPRTLTT